MVFNRTITRYVEDEGNGYAIRVEILEPDENEDDPLQRAGYSDATPLYSVFSGGEIFSDHDLHRLVREADEIDSWVIDHLEPMAQRLLPDEPEVREGIDIVRDLIEEADEDYTTREAIIAEGIAEGYSESAMGNKISSMRLSGEIYIHEGEIRPA